MASSHPHPAHSHDLIRVPGAREHNLKDHSAEIPKRRLTVFTGVSGSGKSSLVVGTIAAESPRFEGTPATLVEARSTLTGEHLAAFVGSQPPPAGPMMRFDSQASA